MSAGIPLRELLVVVSLTAAGLGGTVASLSGRGADDAFLLRQENPLRVTPAAVERLMLTAPELEAPRRRTAIRSHCRAEGHRELRNPWRCTVSYPSDAGTPFRVTIRPDGSYVARYLEDDSAPATGCCLQVPSPE